MVSRIVKFMEGNTIAMIALFVALGGTATAATTLAANSVGSKQIKKNAVTSAKIKSSAVTSAKIKSSAVTTAKVKDGAVTTAKLAAGAVTSEKLAAGAVDTTKVGALPGARVRSIVTQSINTHTSTALTFTTVDQNTGGVYDATKPDRLTAPVAGTYVVTASIAWSNDLAGLRELGVRANGTTYLAHVSGSATATNSAPEQNVATTCHLNAGEYVQVIAWQTSGGAMDSWNAADYAPLFTMNWIAP